jgi:hypothetical protein
MIHNTFTILPFAGAQHAQAGVQARQAQLRACQLPHPAAFAAPDRSGASAASDAAAADQTGQIEAEHEAGLDAGLSFEGGMLSLQLAIAVAGAMDGDLAKQPHGGAASAARCKPPKTKHPLISRRAAQQLASWIDPVAGFANAAAGTDESAGSGASSAPPPSLAHATACSAKALMQLTSGGEQDPAQATAQHADLLGMHAPLDVPLLMDPLFRRADEQVRAWLRACMHAVDACFGRVPPVGICNAAASCTRLTKPTPHACQTSRTHHAALWRRWRLTVSWQPSCGSPCAWRERRAPLQLLCGP